MLMVFIVLSGRKRFLIVVCLFIGIFIVYFDCVNVLVLVVNEFFLVYMGIEGMLL